MAPLLADNEPTWRTDFLYEQWLDADDEENETVPPTLAAVRSAQWKYVEYVTGETELYDQVADPFDLENQTLDPAYADVRPPSPRACGSSAPTGHRRRTPGIPCRRLAVLGSTAVLPRRVDNRGGSAFKQPELKRRGRWRC
jgi:hypothetical protein